MQGFNQLLQPLERDVLRALRQSPGLSRRALSQRLQARPNSVGDAVGGLLDQRWIQAGPPDTPPGTTGRPQVPLTLDPTARTVLGVAVRGPRTGQAARVQIRPVGLLGRAAGPAWDGPAGPQATRAVRDAIQPQVLGIALAVPGLIAQPRDTLQQCLPGLLNRIQKTPHLLDNDGHALAARWWLTQTLRQPPETKIETEPQDTLLIRLDDGRLGASVLVQGRPNPGCVRGGNELGHTRLPVDTPRCFCGHTGCLERIASTDFLHQLGASTNRTLHELASAYPNEHPNDQHAVDRMIHLLAIGIANPLQLLRPHRVVLVSELARYPRFHQALLQQIKAQLFPELQPRIAFDTWDQPLASPAESAAHLGLAAIFDPAWDPTRKPAHSSTTR